MAASLVGRSGASPRVFGTREFGRLHVEARLEEAVERVFRFALRLAGDSHQAEDLAQETILRAVRSGKMPSDAREMRVWLFQIAANVWRDERRRTKHAPARAGPIVDEPAGRTASPVEKAIGAEQLERAIRMMDSLPARQREVLYLATCEELSLAEVAEALEITPAAAKASLSLARRRMRELFSGAEKQ